MPHHPMTPFQMELHDCGPTAAPRPYLYGHRQACVGVTQAVLYVRFSIQATRKWSRVEGNVQLLASPFSTQIPDHAVPHTFSQPSCCLILRGQVPQRESEELLGVTALCAPFASSSDLERRSGLEPTTGPRTSPAVRRQASVPSGSEDLSSDDLRTSLWNPFSTYHVADSVVAKDPVRENDNEMVVWLFCLVTGYAQGPLDHTVTECAVSAVRARCPTEDREDYLDKEDEIHSKHRTEHR